MKARLSLLLPVCNAQAWLRGHIVELMEVAPELTDKFEVVVIDDGSTDDTPEIAAELVIEFTQLHVVRHPAPLGREESIASGFEVASGEVAIIGDERYGFAVSQLPRLWRLRGSSSLALRVEAEGRRALKPYVEPIVTYNPRQASGADATTRQARSGGMQLLRRAVVRVDGVERASKPRFLNLGRKLMRSRHMAS